MLLIQICVVYMYVIHVIRRLAYLIVYIQKKVCHHIVSARVFLLICMCHTTLPVLSPYRLSFSFYGTLKVYVVLICDLFMLHV